MAKALAKKTKTELAGTSEEKPSYLQNMEGDGRIKSDDNFGSDDVGQPLIKLLQGTSGENESHDLAKPGIFWHTGADQPLGKNLTFVIACRNRKMLLQAPMEDGQGILARSVDCITWDRVGKWEVTHKKYGKLVWEISTLDVKDSGLGEWGSTKPDQEPQSPPAATLFYDYLVIVLDEDGVPFEFGPAVLSLARSAIKMAKKGLNNKIQMHGDAGRPMQALIFEAKVIQEQGDEGPHYNMEFKQAGFANEALFNNAMEMSNAMKNFKVDGEEGADDKSAPAKEGSGDEF